MKKSTSATFPFSALAGLVLALGALNPIARAQTTITFTDTQVSTTARTTTAANPLTFTIASGAATENGVVSGDGSLTKTGAGFLRLGATNTYSGGTFLSAGTLDLSADNALGTGAITITGGGLRAGGAPRWLSNALFTSGSFTVGRLTNFSGAMTLTGATTIIASNPDGPANGDSTFSGAIGGNFGLTFAEGAGSLGIGSGYLVLSGANTYTGGTTLRTRVSIDSDAGLGAASGALTMDGGTLRETTSISSARNLILGAGGGTFEVNGFSSFTGTVSGSGGFTQAGGFLGLLGPLTYTGPTTITNNGVIKFGNNGAGFSTLQTSGITINSGGLYFGDDVIYGGPITGAGHVKHEFAGTTVLTGTVAHTGGTQINAGTIQIGNGGTTGSLSGEVALSSGGNLAFKRSDAVTFTGLISGSGTLTQLGTGTLTLTNVNSYTDGTTITGGKITMGNAGALGTGAVSVSIGATLDASTYGFDLSRLSGAGTIISSGAYTASPASNLTLATSLTGTASLTKTGAAALTLTGTNTYSGTTTISAGTVALSGVGTLGSGTVLLTNGATLDLGGTTQTVAGVGSSGSGATGNITAGTLSSSGNIFLRSGTFANTWAGGRLWIGGNASATVTLDGANNAVFAADHNQVLIGHSSTGAAGTVKLGNANALAAATENVEIWSGTLDLNGQAGVRANSLFLKNGSASFLVNNSTGSAASFAGGVTLSTGTANLGGAGALTLSGILSGTGNFTKVGAGTLTLSGANTYTGATTITGGLVNFATSANLGTNNITLNGGGLQWATGSQTDISSRLLTMGINGGTLDTNGNNVTFASQLYSNGALIKSGAGTLTLTGNNTAIGGITISGGALQLGNGGTTGYLFGTIVDHGSLVFNRSDAMTYSGAISGTGSVTKTGANTLTLDRANTYTGSTIISGGVLQIGNGTDGSIVGDVVNDASLVFNRSNALTYSGAISGSGSVTKEAAGILTLTGTSTYTGGTQINGGAIQLGNDGTTGSLAGNVALSNGGSLAFKRSDAVTFTGLVSGSGGLTQSGTGALTLTGANSYTGVTTITSGQVTMGNTAALGTGAVSMSSGATLDASTYGFDLNRLSGSGTITTSGAYTASPASGVTIDTVLTGTASLTKTGTGTLTLSGTNTYSGGTTISAGTLQIGVGGTGGALAGNIVNNAALVINRSSTTTLVGIISGTGSLTNSGSGTLVLVANETYTGGTTISSGRIQIGSGGTAGSIVGDVAVSAGAVLAFNRSDAPTFAGVVSGAGGLMQTRGLLTLTGNNTYSGGTTINAAGVLNFATGANLGTGAITLNFGGLQWATDNETDISSRLAPFGSGGATFNTNGNNVTFASALSGTGALTKSGSGTLTLGATNTYAGNTTITGGLINFSALANLGTGKITLNGGGLQWATGSTTDISPRFNSLGGLGSAGGVFDTNGNDVTLASLISGSGALTKTGSGVLTLSKTNTYAGGTVLNAGVLGLGGTGVLGAGTLTINGGGIRAAGADRTLTNAITVNGNFTLGRLTYLTGAITLTGNVTITSDNPDTAAPLTSILGPISGAQRLTFTEGANPVGTLILAGANTYTGGTTIAAGHVQIGDGSTHGSIVGDIVDNGSLTFNRSDATTYAGVISGSGSVAKSGGDTLTLTGNNTYAGATTVNAGVLQLGNGGTTGSLAGNVALSGSSTLAFNRSDSLTFAGVISGAGSVTQSGSGALTLTNANTYTGGTAINAGQVAMGNAGALGTGSVSMASGTVLDASTYLFDLNRLSGAGTITTSGAYTASPASDVTLATNLTGTASLTKTGAGTLTLSGTNTYSGGTTITGGLVNFATAANLGTGLITLDGGGLQWNTGYQTNVLSRLNAIGAGGATFYNTLGSSGDFATALTGVGGIVKDGPGGLSLTAANTYLGPTTVRNGGLNVLNNGTSTHGTLGSGLATVGGGGASTYADLTFWDQASAGSGTFIAVTNGAVGFRNQSTAGSGTFTANGGTIADGYGGQVSFEDQATAGSATIIANGGTASGAVGGQVGFDTNSDPGNATLIANGGTNGGLGGGIAFYRDATAGSAKVKLYGNGFLDFSSGYDYNPSLGAIEGTRLGIGSLEGDGRVILGVGLTVGANHASTVFAGVIQDGGTQFAPIGSLTKVGTGTLTLTGNNTYSGGTTISFGTVKTGHASAFGSGPIAISAAGATLALNGTAIANPVSVTNGGRLSGSGVVGTLGVSSGGTISPGDSPGILSAAATTFGPGGSYVWEIDSAASPATSAGTRYDLLSIAGALTITATSGSPFTINLTSLLANNSAGNVIDFNSAVNSSYTIATASGGIVDFSSSAFTLNTTGFTNALNGGSWSITSLGNDLNLTFTAGAIPEPSTYAALLGAAALGLATWRRRRKR